MNYEKFVSRLSEKVKADFKEDSNEEDVGSYLEVRRFRESFRKLIAQEVSFFTVETMGIVPPESISPFVEFDRIFDEEVRRAVNLIQDDTL